MQQNEGCPAYKHVCVDSLVLRTFSDPGKPRVPTTASTASHSVRRQRSSVIRLRRGSTIRFTPDAEDRYIVLGRSEVGRNLVVSFTERGDLIRIISARQMTPRERRVYEQSF